MATPPKRIKRYGLPKSAAEKPAFESDSTVLGSAIAEPIDPKAASGIPKKTDEEMHQDSLDQEKALNDEIDANFRLAYDSARDWIEEAKEDIKFKSGDQWAPEDKASLEIQKRPCMTFNKIGPIVSLLSGHFIQNSARIQVSPEGGEDQQFSEVADKVMDHIDDKAQLEFNLGYAFAGMETTGRSYIELYVDYEKDPMFGELKSIYHGKPGVIFPDPRGNAYDLNQDREFVFKLIKRSKAWLKETYPDKLKLIDEITQDTESPMIHSVSQEGDQNNYGLDKRKSSVGINTTSPETLQKPAQKQFHVKEYWRVKYLDKWFVYFVDKGDMPKFDSEKEAQAEIEKRKADYLKNGGDETLWNPQVKKRKRKEYWVAIRCGGKVLADGKSPLEPHYSGFPFFQAIAKWTPEAEDEKLAVQGIVRCLKDPQREKNKARSAFLHIIATSANSGWIIDEDAMPKNKKDELKNFGSTPGIIVEKKTGKEVSRIEPTAAPLAQQVREKAASDDFKEVTGVNSDLLAIDESGNPSGKAIALRIRQAITILEPEFRNFRYTKRLIGNAIMQIVPTLFDIAKLKKVLGAAFMTANKIDDTYLKAFMIQIEDIKYNVRIAEQGDTKTLREETFEDLMNMIQNGMQIPFDVMAEYMTMPNKTEVIQKVAAHQQQQQQLALAAAQAKGGARGAQA